MGRQRKQTRDKATYRCITPRFQTLESCLRLLNEYSDRGLTGYIVTSRTGLSKLGKVYIKN